MSVTRPQLVGRETELEAIVSLFEAPELVALLSGLDCADGDTDDCGARDWAVLDQRMHYIAHLFRAFHVHQELTNAPFTEEQLRSIRGGVVPAGEL